MFTYYHIHTSTPFVVFYSFTSLHIDIYLWSSGVNLWAYLVMTLKERASDMFCNRQAGSHFRRQFKVPGSKLWFSSHCLELSLWGPCLSMNTWLLFLFFETGFLYVIAQAVLEPTQQTRLGANREHTCLCLLSAGTKSVCHHHQTGTWLFF